MNTDPQNPEEVSDDELAEATGGVRNEQARKAEPNIPWDQTVS